MRYSIHFASLLCAINSIQVQADSQCVSIALGTRVHPTSAKALKHRDNCARAVGVNSQAQLTPRRVDCSAFQRCIVTPTTVTCTSTTYVTTSSKIVTVTAAAGQRRDRALPILEPLAYIHVDHDENRHSVNVGEEIIPRGRFDRRALTTAVTNCPTAVPTYASLCSGRSAYASACSCAGVTRSYSTLSTPTSIKTVTCTAAQKIITTTVRTGATQKTTAATVQGVAIQTAQPKTPQKFFIRAGNNGSYFPQPMWTSWNEQKNWNAKHIGMGFVDQTTYKTPYPYGIPFTTINGNLIVQNYTIQSPVLVKPYGDNSMLYIDFDGELSRWGGLPVGVTFGEYNPRSGYPITFNLGFGRTLALIYEVDPVNGTKWWMMDAEMPQVNQFPRFSNIFAVPYTD